MERDSVISVYKKYAPFYDLIFGKIFEPGRKEVHKQLATKSGDKILEVGVGTGVSLLGYPKEAKVIGIDISEEMLAQAKERTKHLSNVELLVMDAEEMDFEDNSFDSLALMHVVSVVPNPLKLMREAKRVCKPGGSILILNHFSESKGLVSFAEKKMDKLFTKLGWHLYFSVDSFVADNDLNVVNSKKVNLFKYWSVLHVKNDE